MIDDAERDEWAHRFGVSAAQISRDHFISHILDALGTLDPDTRFFGGTALCRTLLDGSRLSEDIDLLHPEPREFLALLHETLPRALRREFPDTSWSEITAEGDGLASWLESPGVAPVKVYVGHDGSNTAAWQFTRAAVALRYADLPSTREFQCPTPPAFAAMKLSAWSDRRAPRDLFDLAGLADLGTLRDPEVERIYRTKWGHGIVDADFDRVPALTADAWETELAAQVATLPPAVECLKRVRDALAATRR
jgi:hypothetical protein